MTKIAYLVRHPPEKLGRFVTKIITLLSTNLSYLQRAFEWILSPSAAFEIIWRNVLVHGRLNDVDDPRGRVVAEVRHGHSRRGVDRRQEPEEDDGEEAEDWEEDQYAARVHDGADEQEEAEESEQSWKRNDHFVILGFSFQAERRTGNFSVSSHLTIKCLEEKLLLFVRGSG